MCGWEHMEIAPHLTLCCLSMRGFPCGLREAQHRPKELERLASAWMAMLTFKFEYSVMSSTSNSTNASLIFAADFSEICGKRTATVALRWPSSRSPPCVTTVPAE